MPNALVLVSLIGALTPAITLSLWSFFSDDYMRLFLNATVARFMC